MTRAVLKKILIGVFLTAFIVLLVGFNARKPRILVLHSFSKDTTWSKYVNTGIQGVLKKNRNPVAVKFHYLDLDLHQDPERMKNAVAEAHRAIALQKPDILIAFDDESNDLVAREYADREKPKIVFAATLLPPSAYGYGANGNVSGIMEHLPLDAVREAILTARRGKPARIAVLAMHDDTGRAELAQVQSYRWGPHRLMASHAGNDFAGWQQFTAQMADKVDIVLVLSYGGMQRAAKDHREMPRKEIAGWLERNAKPLPISICESYAEDGGGLAITPAPVDFGERSMQMALAWIEARKGAPPPPVASSPHFRVGLRGSLLAARGITMPPIYIEAARIGNAYFP